MRTFKPAWFAEAARKAGIADRELCAAIRDVAKGQDDDLGGGVFKKRLNRNRHRSIILTKVGSYWLSQYLFAKNDRANIDDDELRAFRQLAKALEKTSEADIARLVSTGHITEICDGGEADI